MKILMSDRVVVRLGIVVSAFMGASLADDMHRHHWFFVALDGVVLLCLWLGLWRATRKFSGELR